MANKKENKKNKGKKEDTLTAKKKPRKPASTQDYVDIAEVRDNIVILNNGTIRSVLLVSSVNFALKSEEEQRATISGYVSFLNSLDFPIQIVIQSRPLNIDVYIETLKQKEEQQANELLRMQIAEYRSYIQELVELGEIMSKRFYVVVPYNPAADGTTSKGVTERVMAAFAPTRIIKLKEEKFQKMKLELDRRISHVLNGLTGMGLSTVQLDTQSLIELYYNTYNPDLHGQQKLTNLNELRLEA